MAQVSYPGVYIEEVPSGVRTITAVSTSVAAFLGRTSKGKINKAMRILSLADYERTFGAPHAKSTLAQSVRAFFDNGGTDCYVVRLARDAKAATVTLENLAGLSVLVAKAKAEGVWGNTVRLEVDYNTPSPYESFNLRVIHEQGGSVVQTESFTGLVMDPTSPRFAPSFVTASSTSISLELAAPVAVGGATDLANKANSASGFSQSRRGLGAVASARTLLNSLINPASGAPQSAFEISVDGSPFVRVDLGPWSSADINAATLANIRDRFEQRINTKLDEVSATANVAVTMLSPTGLTNVLVFTSNGGAIEPEARVTIRRASSNDIAAALMMGTEQGGVERSRHAVFRPAPNATLYDNPDVWAALTSASISALTVDTTSVALNAAPYDLRTTGLGTDAFTLSATGHSPVTGESDGVREKLRIIANAITNAASLDYRAEVWGTSLAVISTSGGVNERPGSIATSVAAVDASVVINARRYTLGTGGNGAFSNSGDDGTDGIAPDLASYLGSEAAQTGLHALDPVDLFNLLILPEDEDVDAATLAQLWSPASVYCQKRRAFLLVDPPASWTDSSGRPQVVSDTSAIGALRDTLTKTHAAAFYPRLEVNDAGKRRTLPPSGAIAGLIARTDATRGVWKAPAGIEAGIRNVLGPAVKLTDAENGVLNKKGVNCIRALPNGIVNWGARTLDGDDDFGSEWKYIPIRRLALMIEESLFRGTRWVVFEPNDEPLWANIRLNINAFMFSLFRQGAFQGSGPKEAYYVKCDKETTTQDDRNKGIVNIEVGFAPLKPAEFVVIKIQQIAGEL